MATFCTLDDIAAFLHITIPADDASATRAIAEASAAIQNYTRQMLEWAEDDRITLDNEIERTTKLFLPELPVSSVASVVEDGEALTVDTDYKLGQHGILHRIGAYWASGIQIVTVTYSHGYGGDYGDALPEDITSVCTRAAARAYQAGLRAAMNAGVAGVQAKTLGDYSVQFASEQSGGGAGMDGSTLGASAAVILLPSEKRMLDRYKVKRA